MKNKITPEEYSSILTSIKLDNIFLSDGNVKVFECVSEGGSINLNFKDKYSFSESESIEVQEFIDVGEYGIALETIIDIINEESKNITNEAEFLIEKAGRIMNMDTTSIVDKISKHIDK